MSKHTSAPWDYFVGNANGRGLIRIEASHLSEEGGKHIASMPRGKESEANARLIASAPELLEALRVMTDVFQPRSGEPSPDMHVETVAWEQARQAIAKAEAQL